MKDLDKDFDTKDNSDEKDNRDLFSEVESDVNSFENVKESKEGYEQETAGQSIADEEEKEAAASQKEASSEEEKAFEAKDKANESVGTQYSTYYTPPYYVPNFVVSDGTAENKDNKKGKRSPKKALIIVGIVAGVLALCMVVGLGAFAISKVIKALLSGDYSDYSGEEVGVTQNAPQMNITQNTDPTYEPKSLPEVVSKVGNSVVEISVTDRSGFMDRYVTEGAGSGVIITQSESAGYLLTNYHVVYNDEGSVIDNISVVLTNAEAYEAEVLGSDADLDLALLRIEKKEDETFTVAQLGDSSKLVVGQEILAIGNPLGSLGGTVTDGIISALDRRIKIDGVEMVLLQHNAAINPGNSGGALFDMMGNLVGIVNAKTSDIGVEGLGFAIPSNIALNFLNRIMVVEPAIGISVQYGSLYGDVGLWVTRASGEFRRYDKIIAVNGEEIASAADYYAVIGDLKKGDTVTISVMRNGKKIDITVTIG